MVSFEIEPEYTYFVIPSMQDPKSVRAADSASILLFCLLLHVNVGRAQTPTRFSRDLQRAPTLDVF